MDITLTVNLWFLVAVWLVGALMGGLMFRGRRDRDRYRY